MKYPFPSSRMVQINFEHMQKTLTKVIEYFDDLKVQDATDKNLNVRNGHPRI